MSHKPLHSTPISLVALTRTNADGEVFKRNPAVERQILDALSLTDDDLLMRAGIEDSSTTGYLQEEALVYFIRISAQRQKSVLFNKLSDILLTRSQEQVMFQLRSLEHKEEAFHEVVRMLYEKILAPGDEGDYLQVRYWHMLKRLSIDVYRQYHRDQANDWHYLQPSSYVDQEEAGDTENEWENIPENKNNELAEKTGLSSVEMDVILREGLHVLKDPIRTAFLLYYFEGWQIESNDPNEITVSKYFSRTPKTIYNWLKQAEEKLIKWRGDHHE